MLDYNLPIKKRKRKRILQIKSVSLAFAIHLQMEGRVALFVPKINFVSFSPINKSIHDFFNGGFVDKRGKKRYFFMQPRYRDNYAAVNEIRTWYFLVVNDVNK